MKGLLIEENVAYPMVSKMGEVVKSGKRRIGIVGTPCEMRRVRKIQNFLLKEVPQVEITAIGLFCFESFIYESLVGKTKELLDIDLASASKTQITKGKYIVTVNGSSHEAKVSMLNDAIRPNCKYCDDFVARLADISVGSVGSEEGYSTIIVRLGRGAKLLDLIAFSKGDVNKKEISRLVSLKQKRMQTEG